MKRLLSFLLVMTVLCGAGATDYKLYFLGGQSNMAGYGKIAELTESQAAVQKDVFIFHGNTGYDNGPLAGHGVWRPLQPGHGDGFRFDGSANVYSERFGVELTFARTLREEQPDQPVAIIKYAKGGTSIDARAAEGWGCWQADFNLGTGINQFDHFLATLNHALAVSDIDGDGQADRLIPAGIVWMQGESDAWHSLETAAAYKEQLRELMNLIRAAFRVDDLPVVIGRISDSGRDDDGLVWNWGNVVRKAQADWTEADGHAALVTSTDGYDYSDPWHYDSAGFLDLGRQFALAMLEVQSRPLIPLRQSTYYEQQKTQFEGLPTLFGAIMLLGDSITDCGEWSELLPGYTTQNRGISGDRTDGVLNRIGSVVSASPDKIFLMIGVNDLSVAVPEAVIVENYRRIIETIREGTPRTKLYIESVLPVNPAPEFSRFKDHVNKSGAVLSLNKALKGLAQEYGLTYIDLHSRFCDADGHLDKAYTNDGLHLMGPGFQLWKTLLKPYLEE